MNTYSLLPLCSSARFEGRRILQLLQKRIYCTTKFRHLLFCIRYSIPSFAIFAIPVSSSLHNGYLSILLFCVSTVLLCIKSQIREESESVSREKKTILCEGGLLRGDRFRYISIPHFNHCAFEE